ncbi:MAG: hypothetical protein H0V16_02515 [Burkholderiaceae bacterium]|nr:hypothetical protein [Burkholderiaceae bacterium]
MGTKKEPFRLVRDPLSCDTIECLQRLLADAEHGQILGIAYAAMYKGREYVVGATGEARRSTTFARGMVDDLHDELRDIRDRSVS